MKFVSLSGFGNDKATAIAEFAIIYEGAKLHEDAADLEYQRIESASTDIDEGINADNKKPKNRNEKPAESRAPARVEILTR